MAKCGEGVVRIVQVIPCDAADWRAVFLMEDDVLATEPVACWLLVDHGLDRHVHPAVPMGTDIGDAVRAGNYLGVVAPGVDPATLRSGASPAAPALEAAS